MSCITVVGRLAEPMIWYYRTDLRSHFPKGKFANTNFVRRRNKTNFLILFLGERNDLISIQACDNAPTSLAVFRTDFLDKRYFVGAQQNKPLAFACMFYYCRSCDNTLEDFLFQISSYSPVYARII